MCGKLDYLKPEKPKKHAHVWRMTTDMKHITFYNNLNNCEGRTKWCRKNCYCNLIPLPKKYRDLESRYFFEEYKKSSIIKQDFYQDFRIAKYVTFFGSGTWGTWVFKMCDYNGFIKTISEENKDKVFRIFIRVPLYSDTSTKEKENIRIIFSVDCDTSLSYIEYALESDTVSGIAVVNHPDNDWLIKLLGTRLSVCIYCSNCNDTYKCFHSKEKFFLLLDDKNVKSFQINNKYI